MEGNEFVGICVNGSKGSVKRNYMRTNTIHGALFGVAIGDALGVPAEFKSRTSLLMQPVQDFEGYKSHNQPPGTFSDDSSLTFCLAESLCKGYDLYDIGSHFIKWLDEAY